MSENMVRMQVYIPRSIYDRLQKRAAKRDLTLAVQIRAALEGYLERVEAEEGNGILHADDPIFKMIGMFDSGLGDLSLNHDHYLYGFPKREEINIARDKPAKSYKTQAPGKRRKTK